MNRTTDPDGTPVFDCRRVELRVVVDDRGTIYVAEAADDIPFEIKRTFHVVDLSSIRSRGRHAHHTTHQAFFCISGEIQLTTRRPRQKERSWSLRDPGIGVYLPPLTWVEFIAMRGPAVALVLASTHYDEADYIRDLTTFDSMELDMGV